MLTQENYILDFHRVEKAVGARGGGNGQEQPWLDDLRRRGIERFREVGFPSGREEEWRQTSVAPITKVKFQPAVANGGVSVRDVYPHVFRHEAACELVFVNGIFSPGLSELRQLPKGARVVNLVSGIESVGARLQAHLGKVADIKKNPFVALNSGFIRDGAVVLIDRGTAFEKPIHLLFLSTAAETPAVSHPRVLIVAEDNIDAKVVETYAGIGKGVYFTNAVSEIVVGNNSRIDHCRLQHESLDAFHVSTTQAVVGRASTFITQSATLGGQLTRNDLNVVLNGEGAEATLNGLVIINGNQHVDNHTLLDHAAPNCPSHELYKHVLGGSARGVFRGKILVRPPAQKTDSKQTSRSLLLSDDAQMNSQPALEIYADDVKCTHGSTTGPVDEEMMFYLRSRGVSTEASRALLTYAFAADITRRIQVEPVRRYLENYMAAQHDLPQDLRITDLGRHDEKHR
jgi:Fe-S cluster assembly protein SufD